MAGCQVRYGRTSCRGCVVGGSALDRDAHGTGGAFDDLGRSFEVVGVEVGLLGGGDLTHLGGGDLADLVGVRTSRALLMPAAFLISSAAGGVLVMNVNVRSS